MQIRKGMFLTSDGGRAIETRNRPPYQQQVARGFTAPPGHDDIAEIRKRQEQVRKALDFVNGGDGSPQEGTASSDKLEWLMKHGFI